MYNETELLEELKAKINDQGVFSEDQIAALQQFADEINYFIDAKIQNFASTNL